jgi:hypothetical protein
VWQAIRRKFRALGRILRTVDQSILNKHHNLLAVANAVNDVPAQRDGLVTMTENITAGIARMTP